MTGNDKTLNAFWDSSELFVVEWDPAVWHPEFSRRGELQLTRIREPVKIDVV